ncbi:MAG: cysteine desulfurase family protein [Planctomycetota bacterium]
MSAAPTPIYLDHNATTPILPEAADAVRECLLGVHANAGSQHAAGRSARRVLEEARLAVAEMLGANLAGANPDRLILTSGGTESNNLALRSVLASVRAYGEQPRVVISAIEHPSVDATANQLEREGVAIDRAPVDSSGVVNVGALESLLRPETRLVSVMLASNETGVLQPVAEVARRCAARGIAVHTDATQAVGKVAVDFVSIGAAMMTFTAHKFHGPVGVGGLLVRGGTPELEGFGGQAGAERPGTPAVALAVGMRVALSAWLRDADDRQQRMTTLRDRFETTILAATPGTRVIGADAPRLPHTSDLAFEGLNRQALVMALDRAAVACSTGSACASGSSEPSPTLLAMGLPEAVVSSALRFSLGALTTAAEIDDAATRIASVCRHLRNLK